MGGHRDARDQGEEDPLLINDLRYPAAYITMRQSGAAVAAVKRPVFHWLEVGATNHTAGKPLPARRTLSVDRPRISHRVSPIQSLPGGHVAGVEGLQIRRLAGATTE